jgi:large subunit ribosomal protein L23
MHPEPNMAQVDAKYYRVIRQPIVTEKSMSANGPMERDKKGQATGDRRRTYAFWVDVNANKIEIADAVEKIFDVKVEKVRTLITKGKTRRFRYHRKTMPPRKKAIVTLVTGDAIDFV